jgi:hypothetical protein
MKRSMKRRDFFGTLGLGSAALMTPAFGGVSAPKAEEGRGREEEEHGAHDQQEQLSGRDANAVVNFGQWKTVPPHDRFLVPSPPPPANNHGVFPYRVKIQQGGSVSFIISGTHQILVYGPGTELADVSSAQQEPGPPVALVNDPNNRIYRGPDPRPATMPRDRVESVHFPVSGRFLVVCGVLPHFVDGMHGFVDVKAED